MWNCGLKTSEFSIYFQSCSLFHSSRISCRYVLAHYPFCIGKNRFVRIWFNLAVTPPPSYFHLSKFLFDTIPTASLMNSNPVMLLSLILIPHPMRYLSVLQWDFWWLNQKCAQESSVTEGKCSSWLCLFLRSCRGNHLSTFRLLHIVSSNQVCSFCCLL